MAITIKGIRVDSVLIERNESTGRDEIKNAQYSLISSTDHVLAKQSIGGYGSMVLTPSPTTIKALEAFASAYKADVVATLGLETQ